MYYRKNSNFIRFIRLLFQWWINKIAVIGTDKEKTQSLIVGIERQGTRILNPDSTTFFFAGDVIWLAGNTKLIKEFQRKNRLRTMQ